MWRSSEEWKIPRIDAAAQLAQQALEEEQRNALVKGTTAQGREILRKILFCAERLVQQKDHTLEQIVAIIEEELKLFRHLQPELALFLSRIWGLKSDWSYSSTFGFAIMIVFRTGCMLQLERSEPNE